MGKGRARLVEGGIDHGTMWEGISISSKADAESVAHGLYESFDDQWCRELIEHLVERVSQGRKG